MSSISRPCEWKLHLFILTEAITIVTIISALPFTRKTKRGEDKRKCSNKSTSNRIQRTEEF